MHPVFENTFVSSFIDLNPLENRPEDKNFNFYIKHAFRLLSTKKFPFVVFLDSKTKKIFEEDLEICSLNRNVILVETSHKEFRILNFLNPEKTNIPNSNNPKKDTFNYIANMLDKTHCVKTAIELNPFQSKRFTWIDLGILHIIKENQIPIFFKTLETIETFSSSHTVSQQQPDERITKVRIPGCYSPLRFKDKKLFDFFNLPCWAFCGGFFSGEVEPLIEFDNEVEKCFEILKEKNFITWEINIWTYIYCKRPELFDFYIGDHNISMIENFIK